MIDFDAYDCDPRPPIRWRRIALLLAAVAAVLALTGLAHAQEQPRATVYVNACDPAGKCKTVAIPVPSCVKGGQAQIAALLAGTGVTVRAFKCVEGDEA